MRIIIIKTNFIKQHDATVHIITLEYIIIVQKLWLVLLEYNANTTELKTMLMLS